MTGAPALVNAIVILGSMFAIVSQSTDEMVERHCHLSKIGNEGRPVVLLQVDIDGVVAPPG